MLHAETIRLFGGSVGVRDASLLESALGRPRNKWQYHPGTSGVGLAAAYGFGIARNHAFVDGNKRTALLAMRAFLFINGYRLAPDEIETVTVIEGLAAGTVDEESVTAWIETNTSERRME
jgi:death-on-curing protein